MHFFAERGEPLAVTTPEVTEDRLVGVHAEELAYDTSMVRTSASESLGEGRADDGCAALGDDGRR